MNNFVNLLFFPQYHIYNLIDEEEPLQNSSPTHTKLLLTRFEFPTIIISLMTYYCFYLPITMETNGHQVAIDTQNFKLFSKPAEEIIINHFNTRTIVI